MFEGDSIWEVSNIFLTPCYMCRDVLRTYTEHILPDYSFVIRFFPDFKLGRDYLCELCFSYFRDLFKLELPQVPDQVLEDERVIANLSRLLEIAEARNEETERREGEDEEARQKTKCKEEEASRVKEEVRQRIIGEIRKALGSHKA